MKKQFPSFVRSLIRRGTHALFAPSTANCELRTANCELRTANCELQTANCELRTGKARGFSLIEVNIAILVVAGGLLSLFAIFPAGLRMSTDALSDTRQALFADDFFAYFDDGVLSIENRDDWQDIEKFWTAARGGLKDGFGSKATIDNANSPWHGDTEVCKDWAQDPKHPLGQADFSKGKNAGSSLYLRFYHGKVEGYFTDNAKTDKLDAEFLVRIASDYNADDGLIWRVSVVVSDDGSGGWYYDNPVYHRDFRYAELP